MTKEKMQKEIDNLKIQLDNASRAASNLSTEVNRLERIIAKELTENDELGSEFVYAYILKNELRSVTQERNTYFEALNTIAQKQEEFDPPGTARDGWEIASQFARNALAAHVKET